VVFKHTTFTSLSLAKKEVSLVYICFGAVETPADCKISAKGIRFLLIFLFFDDVIVEKTLI